MKLTLVIPVRNERETVTQVIRRIREIDFGMPVSMIVVDGASTDGTTAAVAALEGPDLRLIAEPVARGKGAAVIAGFAMADPADDDIVMIQDADLELDPVEIPPLLRPIVEGRADYVMGVRFWHGRRKCPWFHYLGNRGFSFFVSVLWFRPLNDVLTAYKILRGRTMKSLRLTRPGFDLDPELCCRVLSGPWRVEQLPVTYEPRTVEQGKKLSWKAGFGVLRTILWCRFTSGR